MLIPNMPSLKVGKNDHRYEYAILLHFRENVYSTKPLKNNTSF